MSTPSIVRPSDSSLTNMGLGCSRLASERPSRVGSRRPNATKRTISSLFICGTGTSSSKASVQEIEDDHAELVMMKSAEGNKLVASKSRSPRKGLAEITTTSDGSAVTNEGSSFVDTAEGVQTSDRGKCVSEKVLIPPHRLFIENKTPTRASTSYEDRASPGPSSSNAKVNSFVDNNLFETRLEVTNPSSLSPYGPSIENHEREVAAVHNSDSGSSSFLFSPPSSDSIREDTLQESVASDGDIPNVDGDHISSNTLSSGTAEITAHESRRISSRLFWDAFSRRNSRRHSDDADEVRSHERWLLDFGSGFLRDGGRGDSRYLGSRTHRINERRRHSRSEVWERLRGSLDGLDHRDNNESISVAEDSGPQASISRIVMLAEALFEVLDEIHQQPMALSLFMVSLPAPASVVDSLPVRNYKNTFRSETNTEQCQICLAEYEEGNKIRVLPCHHEYHMLCVDKWLKEIHGVCPLCRGDVRESSTEASVLA